MCENAQYVFHGVVAVSKKNFGFIKGTEFSTDVFFHAAACTGAGAGAVAPPLQSPRMAVGDHVAFCLASDSKPTKPVAARVVKLRHSHPETGNGSSSAACSSNGWTVGIVTHAARPPAAANAAWASQLRNGLIRCIDSSSSRTTIRHVAYGTADMQQLPQAEAASGQQPLPATCAAVAFKLVSDSAAYQRAASQGERAAFMASHRAAEVTLLTAADEALLPCVQREQLAILQLLLGTVDGALEDAQQQQPG